MTEVNRETIAHMNPNIGTEAIRIKDFTRINSPLFNGSKVDEDPQNFSD